MYDINPIPKKDHLCFFTFILCSCQLCFRLHLLVLLCMVGRQKNKNGRPSQSFGPFPKTVLSTVLRKTTQVELPASHPVHPMKIAMLPGLQLLGAAFGTIHEVPFASAVAGPREIPFCMGHLATTWYTTLTTERFPPTTIVSSRLQVSIECEVITIIVIYYIYTYYTIQYIQCSII